MPKLKVFLSGTYLDLKPFRDEINKLLRHMQAESVDMEYFPMSENEPKTLSLDQLDGSDIYLAIIGHRYGFVPPGKNFCSITRSEYERAYGLSKEGDDRMRLLIYLAANGVANISDDLREDDAHHKAQQDFRELLRLRHTPHTFTSMNDLLEKVAGGLNRYLLGEHGKTEEITIFDSEQIELIKEKFDDAVQRQIDSVRKCLAIIAQNFAGIFLLDQRDLMSHPLLAELDKVLHKAIPEVSLDLQGGTITRTGVRHVVLRAETFRQLVENVPPTDRRKLGRGIGKGAANDLTENTIKKRNLIPRSPEALVALWNYWDRTGGWGSIRHENPYAVPGANPPKAEWCICVEHNSLAQEAGNKSKGDLDVTDFWCGYIEGFLDRALYNLTEIIFDLPEEKRELVTIPAYVRVAAVECEPCDAERRSDKAVGDRFRVIFREESFSVPRVHLLHSQRNLKLREYFSTMHSASSAVQIARASLDEDEGTKGEFQRIVGEMALDSRENVILEAMLSQKPFRPAREEAENWFRLANRIVHKLAEDEVFP